HTTFAANVWREWPTRDQCYIRNVDSPASRLLLIRTSDGGIVPQKLPISREIPRLVVTLLVDHSANSRRSQQQVFAAVESFDLLSFDQHIVITSCWTHKLYFVRKPSVV